jgi:hypothetical protein
MVSVEYLDNILNLLMISKALDLLSAISAKIMQMFIQVTENTVKKRLRYTLGTKKRPRGRIERAS